MAGARWPRAFGLAVVLVSLPMCPAEAQGGKLTGVVTDERTGTPIDGAQVIVRETGLSAVTGANGRYFVLNVRPGTHTLSVRYLGHVSAEVRNVVVVVDLTRVVDVALGPVGLANEIHVRAMEVPLVEVGSTGSRTNVRAEEIEVLPVTGLWDVLALQAGFFQLPPNSDIIAYVDTRRIPNAPVRVRGGRAGETLALLDGFPINNVVFGGPAFDVGLEAVEQIDYQRGGFEAQYGNALSGIVHTVTREGGTRLEGDLSYQTSGLAGAFGSRPDELAGFSLLEGRLSGPVPGTSAALRFMFAGRIQGGADRVLEFDDEINRPSMTQNLSPAPEWGDLIPGWRAFGYDNVRDLTAKLTYHLRPTMKLTGEYVGYVRQRLPYDFAYLLTGYDYLETPGAGNRADSIALSNGPYSYPTGFYPYDDPWQQSAVVQGSIRIRRNVLLGRWDHQVGGRSHYGVQVGWLGHDRETCNVFQGVCLGDHMADTYTTRSGFERGYSYAQFPYGPSAGTDRVFGGEQANTYLARFDAEGQVSDHHDIRFGALYQKHDVEFAEFRNAGLAGVLVVPSAYAAKPWEGALYVQDEIDYDFLTITLGLRYDFGQAMGLFFANPFNPTNGTTAREVCDGTVPGVSEVPWSDGTLSGFDACYENELLLDSAAALAQFDDFAESTVHGFLSPRIGVSLPLTERSHVFFNYGRYAQHPVYNTAYQNTGIGVPAGEAGGNVCDDDEVVPGTGQCRPTFQTWEWPTPYLGNPDLRMERTTAYEVGFASEVADNVALQVVAFGREQSRLSGLVQGGVTDQGDWAYDWGNTYGANQYDSVYGYWYDYVLIANRDRQVVHGIELSLQRRLSDFWGASVNYTLSRAEATAAAPDLEVQQQENEGEPANLQEIPSEIDRPHVLNASVFLRVGNQAVSGRRMLDAVLRNTHLSFTLQAASGLPYTPILSFYGGQWSRAGQNSGRGPATARIDAFAAKDFLFTEMRVGVFLRVLNLFDQQGCEQAFTSTGLCQSGAVDQTRVPRTFVSESDVTSTFIDRPHFTQPRRSISVGVRVGF
jgi:outer membrane receptor protein involved in Fe transport